MKTLFFILITTFAFGQDAKLNVTLGGHYTGGLSYDMEQTIPSLQLGLNYIPKKGIIIADKLSVSGNYYLDVLSEIPNNIHSYYIFRFQPSKRIKEDLSITYYVGYVNSFDNQIMITYKGNYKNNIAVGGGFQYEDELLTAELIFEHFAGYPHLSMGLNFNIIKLLKNK